MNFLRQGTAVTVAFGPFLNSTDGDTPETALTLTQADVRVSKNGAAFAQKNESSSLTHMENGFYSMALDATDTNTVGTLKVHVHESGALAVFESFQVLEEAIFDALFATASTGALPVSADGITAASIADDAITADHLADNTITAAAIASNAITSAKIAASAIGATQIASSAITSAKIASSAIGASQIASSAITSAKIASGAITTTAFAAGAIDAAAIADNAIDAGAIATDAITSAKIASTATDEIAAAVVALALTKQRRGTAQSGGASTMVLDTDDAATDDFYNGAIVILLEGTGTATLTVAQRTRKITDYVAGSNQITVDEAWNTNPSSDTRYLIIGG